MGNEHDQRVCSLPLATMRRHSLKHSSPSGYLVQEASLSAAAAAAALVHLQLAATILLQAVVLEYLGQAISKADLGPTLPGVA